MKKLFILGTVFFVLLVINTGCQPKPSKKDIATVDSLKTELVHYQLRIDSIQVAQVDSIARKTKKIIAELHEYFEQENVEYSLEDGITFGHFKAVGKGLRDFDERMSNVKKELKYANSQLESLLNDLKNGAIDKEIAERYLAQEKEAISILSKEITSLKNGVDFSVKRYHETIDDVLEKMKKLGLADSIAWH